MAERSGPLSKARPAEHRVFEGGQVNRVVYEVDETVNHYEDCDSVATKQAVKLLSSVKDVLVSSNRRLNICKDPVAKNLIRLERMCSMLDMMLLGLKSSIGDSDQVNSVIDEISSLMYKEIEELMLWVQSPVYSPDHPIGAQMMKEASESFKEKL